MRIETTIIRSHHGRLALTDVKGIDILAARLIAAKCTGKVQTGQFLPVILGLDDLYDDSSQILSNAVAQFTLHRDNPQNSTYYRTMMKQGNQGKKLRVRLRTTAGERLFGLFTSIDTTCCLVTMLTMDGKLSQVDAKQFFSQVDAINACLGQTNAHMRRIVENVT